MNSISYEILTMGMVDNSPSHSSAGSDEFVAFLDAELEEISSSLDQEEGEVKEKEKEREKEKEEDVDFEIERIKRQRVQARLDNVVELQGSTTLAPMPRNSDASLKFAICRHKSSIMNGMCVECGQQRDDGSAVALDYVQKGLKIGSEELARLRAKDLKSSLQNKKLYLVLDLDHTLLNSTWFKDISPDEEYLKSQTDSLQDIPNGSLFRLDSIHVLTKLRPFVRTFLEEASSMYEMYVYTMGERSYALEMRGLLDPRNVYFESKVISKDDCTQKHQKGLDVMLGTDRAVIILDDTESVWPKDRENLILIDRYHYFSSSCRAFGLKNVSLSQSKRDESESNGLLATILQVLKRIHQIFFDLDLGGDLMGRDARQVLKTLRKEVLKGCKLVFSGIWKISEQVENQRLWKMAEQLGATCTKELDPSVTHVICMRIGTEKASWAVKHQKFLVNPRWIEAANFLWKRQPEENFAVHDS